MFRLFLRLYWKMRGWKIAGNFPVHLNKMLFAVAPHTHWEDIFVGFATRLNLNIPHAKFLAKKELFKGPLGWLLTKLGGTPVDRYSKQGMVEQAAALFTENEKYILALAPEGTRKRVDRLRTGFYHIAKTAGVPIVPIGLDYKNKNVVFGEPFLAGDDEEADLKKLINFYSGVEGRKPMLDLRHLKE